MTWRFRALLTGCTGLVLAASLGAGPASQPVDIRRDNFELLPKAAELKLDVRFLQKPLETIQSARVYVPRMPEASNAMPGADVRHAQKQLDSEPLQRADLLHHPV